MKPVVKFLVLAALACWTQLSLPARAQEGGPAVAPTEIFMEMRDGVKLAADVFFPAGEGPWPVILMRTPYLKDRPNWAEGARRYTDNGYVYVIQDSRGRGHSEGRYDPFQDDIPDGYDTVEWIAVQDWSDGNVGMTGGSAMGIAANLAAISNPPHLKAAYVVVAPTERFSNTFVNGVFKEQDSGSWMRRQDAGDKVNPIKKRVTRDVFWDRTDIAPNLEYVRIPIFNVGGWYDIFAKGGLANFRYLQNEGAAGARGNQKLRMGPFGHGPLSGDLEYPGEDRLSLSGDEEIRWFDHWLKGENNGIMDEPPVTYFMMAGARKGAYSDKNRYIEAANWPPASRTVRLYLTEERTLADEKPGAVLSKTAYRFDPANPVPTVGGANLTIERGPMDQRAIPARADYLRFETPPLEEDLAIAGQVTVELYAATDGPDTDFMAKLVDVYPDGYEALVLDAPIRTRYRRGRMADDVAPMWPGAPEKLVIDLWSTAITFEKGHRIALHVTSSSSPRFEVNPNTGATPGEEGAAPRVALNEVYHDCARPSALVLPVIYLPAE